MDTYRLKNLNCAACARRIEDGLRADPSVRSVSIDFGTLSMRIDASDMARVRRRIGSIEPGVQLEGGGREAPSGADRKDRYSLARELVLLGAGAALLVAGTIWEEDLHLLWNGWSEYLVFGAAYLLAGWKVLAAALRGIVRGRIYNENFLMTVATGGAFAVHEVSEAVGVMVFFKVGEILQERSVSRSRRSIRRLLDLRPSVARVLRDGETLDVSPEQVAVGETLCVRPGEKIPLDGVVAAGTGFVDTSALTGEPVPRRAIPGTEVLAGSISRDASLLVTTRRPARESSAAKIISLVEKATHAKSKTDLFISRFARYYTPAVVAAALIVAFVPPLLLGAGDLRAWIIRSLTMLVISCPCALRVLLYNSWDEVLARITGPPSPAFAQGTTGE